MDMNLRIYLAVVFSLATLPATAQPAQSAQNGEPVPAASGIADGNAPHRETAPGQGQSTGSAAARDATAGHQAVPDDTSTDARSEEHTSELQSLMRTSYAVFCLKKKKKSNKTHNNPIIKN